MPFNGPDYELDVARSEELLPFLHNSAAVYCTQCGTIYVSGDTERDCPSCALAGRLDDLEEKVDRVDRDLDVIDGGGI